MSCKDCIHQEACFDWCRGFNLKTQICEHFKDKSHIVELPCNVGDKAYVIKHYNGSNNDVIETIIADEFDFVGNALFLIYYDNSRGEKIYDAKSIFFTKEEAEEALKKSKKVNQKN